MEDGRAPTGTLRRTVGVPAPPSHVDRDPETGRPPRLGLGKAGRGSCLLRGALPTRMVPRRWRRNPGALAPPNRDLLALWCPLRVHNLEHDPTLETIELVKVAPRSRVGRVSREGLLGSLGPRRAGRKAARAPVPLETETGSAKDQRPVAAPLAWFRSSGAFDLASFGRGTQLSAPGSDSSRETTGVRNVGIFFRVRVV